MLSVRLLSLARFGSILVAGSLSIAAAGYRVRVSQQPERQPPLPQVSVSCSDLIPGTAAATVRWLASRAPFATSRLDVTVYRKGFDRGMYARFTLAQGLVPHPQLNDSSPPRDDSLPAYRLRGERVRSSHTDTAAFRIDGLEDGINYYLRLAAVEPTSAVPGPAARLAAPTCAGRGRPDRD